MTMTYGPNDFHFENGRMMPGLGEDHGHVLAPRSPAALMATRARELDEEATRLADARAAFEAEKAAFEAARKAMGKGKGKATTDPED